MLKPFIQLFVAALLIRLPSPSIAMINKKGDWGSPCLRPLSAGKKPCRFSIYQDGEPGSFDTEFYPLIPPSPESHLPENVQQETPVQVIKAFSISSLHITPGTSPLILLSMHSLAIRAASIICLPLMKAIWWFFTTLLITFFSLSASTFAMIL